MKIFSQHRGHDPNLCFIDTDKNFIYHLEEERLSRIKHGSHGFMGYDMKYIELYGESDIGCVSVERLENLKNFYNNPQDLLNNPEDLLNKSFSDSKFFYSNNKKIYAVTHHLAHASYAYYTYQNDEKCDILVYDGWGYETDRYFYNSSLNLIETTPFGLGFAWKTISNHIFKEIDQEGKIMGLAARGKLVDGFYNALESYTSKFSEIEILPESERKTKKNRFISEASKYVHDIIYKNNYLHEDLAKTIQIFSENKVFDFLEKNKTSDVLLISGGIGLNGYINQKIIDRGIYKNVYVPPACGDCGLSIGAALFAANKIKEFRPTHVAYIGNDYDIDENDIGLHNYRKMNYDEIYNYISDKIIEGKIIGWYQGRSESGPRALGNRSILCDPRTEKMKDYLNERVKHREWFRPFAPAILEEHVKEWFENIDRDPYMLKIAKYKPGMGEKVAAVCHVDYTGRVQTVTKEDNEHFYNLINSFYQKTGIPILLNTSFNDQEPIIDSPGDAIKTFEKTNIDILVLKNYIIEK